MESVAITVTDSSHVAAARQATQRIAHLLEFDEVRKGRVAIAVTEAVSNMVKHGGGGTFTARSVARGEAVGIEVLAIDAGAGMASFAASARDGVSTTGTAGTGLGAMQRLSEEFDVYTRADGGTVVRMVFWSREPGSVRDDYDVGAVCVPKAGETVSGDAWAMERDAKGATILVADVLGHGPDASRAASAAVDVMRAHPDKSPVRILDLAHGRLRPTRGAAVAVLRHDWKSNEVAFAGVGNISACVLEGSARRTMVSHNGIVGHNVHKSQEYRYAWPPGSLLVAHSDGLATQWNVADFPGLATRHPALIAAVLYREYSRNRDDVTVVVARAVAH